MSRTPADTVASCWEGSTYRIAREHGRQCKLSTILASDMRPIDLGCITGYDRGFAAMLGAQTRQESRAVHALRSNRTAALAGTADRESINSSSLRINSTRASLGGQKQAAGRCACAEPVGGGDAFKRRRSHTASSVAEILRDLPRGKKGLTVAAQLRTARARCSLPSSARTGCPLARAS